MLNLAAFQLSGSPITLQMSHPKCPYVSFARKAILGEVVSHKSIEMGPSHANPFPGPSISVVNALNSPRRFRYSVLLNIMLWFCLTFKMSHGSLRPLAPAAGWPLSSRPALMNPETPREDRSLRARRSLRPQACHASRIQKHRISYLPKRSPRRGGEARLAQTLRQRSQNRYWRSHNRTSEQRLQIPAGRNTSSFLLRLRWRVR